MNTICVVCILPTSEYFVLELLKNYANIVFVCVYVGRGCVSVVCVCVCVYCSVKARVLFSIDKCQVVNGDTKKISTLTLKN